MSNYDYFDISTGEGLSDSELSQRYQDMLDEVYGDVDIAGLTYSASVALERVDPVAYRCGFNDWVDSELGETLTEEAPE